TLARTFQFDLATAWQDLPAAVRKVVLHGVPGRTVTYRYDTGRAHGEYQSSWEGVLRHIECRYRETASDGVRAQLEEYMVEQPCQDCRGKRLRPESLAVLVGGKSLGDVVELSGGDALQFFDQLPLRSDRGPGLDREIAGPILKEVNDRLRFLKNVGLAYLHLRRSEAARSARRGPPRPASRPPRWGGGRRGASAWPPRSAAGSWACSTSWTSPPSVSTS